MAAFIDKFREACGSRALAWLLLANCGIFLVVWMIVIIGNYAGYPGNFTMQWLCVSSSAPVALRHFWTAATYMVTHYGFLHLLFNMLWLFWFGRILMTSLSDRHLTWIYAGGGFAGAVLYVAVHALVTGMSDSGSYLCGASASVLAVIAASAIRTPDLRLYLFLIGEVKLKWVALGCIVLTFAGVGGGNAGGQAAHVGGVLFGVLFTLAINAGYDPVKRFADKMRDVSSREPISMPRRKNVRRDGNAVARAAGGRLSDMSRLDELLDKIRLSGYASFNALLRSISFSASLPELL